MKLRRATEADRETLYALWDEWVERESPVPGWVEGAHEGARAGIDSAVSSGAAVVAEERGRVLAFACGLMQGMHIGELTELYVRPEARRRAIARQVVRAVVSELGKRGAAVVTAGVALDNAGAQLLRERRLPRNGASPRRGRRDARAPARRVPRIVPALVIVSPDRLASGAPHRFLRRAALAPLRPADVR